MTGFEAIPVLEMAEPQDGSREGTNKMYQAYKGQLKLSVYINCGHLTVHGQYYYFGSVQFLKNVGHSLLICA